MKKTEKFEFLSQMINEVREIPVEDIIGSEVELIRKGRYLLGLCPFHPDNHIGSFVVTPDKNIWRCFACGGGGNGISFAMKYYDTDFLTVCFKLAIDYNIITQEQADNFFRKKYDTSVIKHIEKSVLSEEKKENNPIKAPEDVIHNVYAAMANICSLSDEHKAKLIKERKMEGSNVDDFFTFPTRKCNLVDKVYQEIKQKMETLEQNTSHTDSQKQTIIENRMKRVEEWFKYVPGFYINSSGKLDFVSFKGMGFLIRDERQHVTGIQIRKDVVKDGENRYVWFSSAFASKTEGCEGGAPSGSSGGYVSSHTGETKALCITEGRFKAEALASLGFNAIYVSGVSSWRSILPIIDRVVNPGQCIGIAFDSDILGNIAVYEQAVALSQELMKKGCKVNFILWNKEHGKGFDDFLNRKGKKFVKEHLTCLGFDVFKKKYIKTLEGVLKNFGVERVREIDKNKIDDFTKQLQSENEKNLL